MRKCVSQASNIVPACTKTQIAQGPFPPCKCGHLGQYIRPHAAWTVSGAKLLQFMTKIQPREICLFNKNISYIRFDSIIIIVIPCRSCWATIWTKITIHRTGPYTRGDKTMFNIFILFSKDKEQPLAEEATLSLVTHSNRIYGKRGLNLKKHLAPNCLHHALICLYSCWRDAAVDLKMIYRGLIAQHPHLKFQCPLLIKSRHGLCGGCDFLWQCFGREKRISGKSSESTEGVRGRWVTSVSQPSWPVTLLSCAWAAWWSAVTCLR